MKTSFFAFLILLPLKVSAVEYTCDVIKKTNPSFEYSTNQLKKLQFSIHITENQAETILSRCSYVESKKQVTCDDYKVDKIASDSIQTQENNFNQIKKYYVFRGQFDVQLFPDLSFIENNGRGGISFGKCNLTSP